MAYRGKIFEAVNFIHGHYRHVYRFESDLHEYKNQNMWLSEVIDDNELLDNS